MKKPLSIGILQPVYLPWLGYFEQMNRVDHFVFQDDVQYTKGDWRNRNRIKSQNGPQWLSVPVKRSPLDTPICEIEIDYGRNWVKKHIRSLRMNYAHANHAEEVISALEEIIQRRPIFLADLTISLIDYIASALNINTSVSRAKDIPRDPCADLNGRLLEIAQKFDATHIYLGAKSAEYVFPEFYAPHHISLEFQNYQHPNYPQQHGKFLSHMSSVDFLMNASTDLRAAVFQRN